MTNEADIRHGRNRVLKGAEATLSAISAQPRMKDLSSLIITPLSEVKPETIQWLWQDRIPWGKLVLLEGDPGLGKSFFTIALAAHVSGGRQIPNVEFSGIAEVLIVSFEDGVADTIVPRCIAAGANLKHIHHIDGVRWGDDERPLVLPDDIPLLRAEIERTGARLLIIDPLAASLSSSINSNQDQEIRRVLTLLTNLADATGTTVLVVRHLRKASGTRAIAAGGGSMGIIAAARIALRVDPAPQERECGQNTRILSVVKSNLAPLPRSLLYTLSSTADDQAHVEWIGETTWTADELAVVRDANDSVSRTQIDEARDALKGILASGEISSRDVLRLTQEEGLSDRTVRRAAQQLGVSVSRRGSGRDHKAYWKLSDVDDINAPPPTPATYVTQDSLPQVEQSGISGKSKDLSTSEASLNVMKDSPPEGSC